MRARSDAKAGLTFYSVFSPSMYPGRGDDDTGFIFIVLDDVRDYRHRCVLTEPKTSDKDARGSG